MTNTTTRRRASARPKSDPVLGELLRAAYRRGLGLPNPPIPWGPLAAAEVLGTWRAVDTYCLAHAQIECEGTALLPDLIALLDHHARTQLPKAEAAASLAHRNGRAGLGAAGVIRAMSRDYRALLADLGRFVGRNVSRKRDRVGQRLHAPKTNGELSPFKGATLGRAGGFAYLEGGREIPFEELLSLCPSATTTLNLPVTAHRSDGRMGVLRVWVGPAGGKGPRFWSGR